MTQDTKREAVNPQPAPTLMGINEVCSLNSDLLLGIKEKLEQVLCALIGEKRTDKTGSNGCEIYGLINRINENAHEANSTIARIDTQIDEIFRAIE